MQLFRILSRTALAPILVVLFLLAGCSQQSFMLPPRDLSQPDINPHPLSDIRDGGTVTLALGQWPTNFNLNEFDGASGYLAELYQLISFSAFERNASGELNFDPTYFTSIQERVTHGVQQIEYHINPQAHWSNGTPITWEDFAVQAQALSGKSPGYEVSSSQGYDHIKTVERGESDKDFVVTLTQPFAEWKSLFSAMIPASAEDTPAKFNTGWLHSFPPTAGPFKVENINRANKVISFVRDPSWWGVKPKLDRIIFRILDRDVSIDPYLTHELDAISVGGQVSDMQRALVTPHTDVRVSNAAEFRHLTFNESPTRLTSEKAVRQAIAKAIDRSFLLRAYNHAVVGDHPPLLNNHFFLPKQKGYHDNGQDYVFDPQAARDQLNQAGWVLHSDGIRYKNNRSLTLTYVTVSGGTLATKSTNQIIQAELADIGVRLILQYVPAEQFFPAYILVGNFDIAHFAWEQGSSPLIDATSIFRLDPRCIQGDASYNPSTCIVNQNFGLQGNRQINALFDRANTITDEKQRYALIDVIDKALWEDMGQLPLFQMPAVEVVDSRLANYGPQTGMTDWKAVGWLKNSRGR